MNAPVHISSLVVHCRPPELDGLARAVAELPGAELACSDPAGRAVVVLETPDERAIVAATDRLNRLPGVLSANLVFHRIDGIEGDPR